MNDKEMNGGQKGSKTAILQALRQQYSAVSRISLSKLTGLSRASVSSAVAELLAYGFVRETEILKSTGGRPAIALELVPQSPIILGADYANQEWTLCAFDLPGNVLRTLKIPVSNTSAEMAVTQLAVVIRQLNTEIDILPVIGLGMPGLVDTELGVIQSAADLGWHNVDIGDMMRRELGWGTTVINRHRARGLAECRYGSGKEFNQMVYVGVGSGIAAGLFYNQQLIPGAVGGAGELGHVTIEPDGPLCPCGNRGCLQLLSASSAIEQEFRKLLRSGENSSLHTDRGHDPQLVKAEAICSAADQGDMTAVKAVDKAATYLGIALATLVNLFNPQGIILGGSIPKAGNYYVDIAVKVMRQRAMIPLTANISVKTASIEEIGGALGAANFALDKYMSFNLLLNHTLEVDENNKGEE